MKLQSKKSTRANSITNEGSTTTAENVAIKIRGNYHETPEALMKAQIKVEIQQKYDYNLRDSDDSSDEEVLIRTGDVPKHWYDMYDHVGYSVKGQKVEKQDPKEADEINKFIEKQNDKTWWLKI